jgi:hypothetical protein
MSPNFGRDPSRDQDDPESKPCGHLTGDEELNEGGAGCRGWGYVT